MNDHRNGPTDILVGFDASAGAQRALSWAVDHAERTGARVELMMAVPEGSGRHQDRYADIHAAADGIVDIALTNLRADKRGFEAHGSVRYGAAADVLIEASRQAGLLVVGRRGHGEVMDALLGSVSMRVCAHALCPVVVIPPGWAAQPGGTVVVGVADAGDRPAVAFAADYAEALAGDLLAVHTWNLPVSGFSPELMIPLVSDASEMAVARDRELEDALAPVRERKPALPVATSVVEGIPARRLTEAAAHAALLVVASHRERGRFPLRIAPTVHAVLHHAPCPVAVVPVTDAR